jgi:hypothetical protein
MSSATYGMRKSLCKVTFDMYQGALAYGVTTSKENRRVMFSAESVSVAAHAAVHCHAAYACVCVCVFMCETATCEV